MAKPPSDDPRVNTVSMRLTNGEVSEMDEARGGMSRSDWLRSKVFGKRKR